MIMINVYRGLMDGCRTRIRIQKKSPSLLVQNGPLPQIASLAAGLPADLAEIAAAWANLPAPLKDGILAMIRAASRGQS